MEWYFTPHFIPGRISSISLGVPCPHLLVVVVGFTGSLTYTNSTTLVFSDGFISNYDQDHVSMLKRNRLDLMADVCKYENVYFAWSLWLCLSPLQVG